MTWDHRQKWMFRGILTAIGVVVLVGATLIIREIAAALDARATGLLQSLPRLLLTAGFWLCSLIGCWYGCLGLHQWRESGRILKKVSSSERHAMSVLCRISESNRVVYGSQPLTLSLGIIGLLAALLLKEPRCLGLVVMVVGLRWWLWVRTTTPPFVLFLSTSDPWSIEVHRQTKRLVSPLRVITLLDLGNSPSSDTANELLLDCLRTGNDDDWWKVITILIELTPLVVINADTESPGVVREALHLISEDITFKTVFLTKGNACLLRRKPEPAASASGCYIASAAMLQEIIKTILDRAEIPEQGRTVRSYASDQSNTKGITRPSVNQQMLSTPPWITAAGLERKIKFRVNPYLKIMMMCPNKNTPIFTGVNSSYFEEWDGNPPKDGASCLCSLCGKTHKFDATNTWLEEIPRL